MRRAALTLGVTASPLRALPDRSPEWPPSITGSITHTDGFCGAVVAERRRFEALGLDAEVAGRVTREIWSLICVPDELAWLETLPPGEQEQAATVIFCIKECFYKCQYSLTREWLDFDAITVQIRGYDDLIGCFVARPRYRFGLSDQVAEPFAGRFRFDGDLVIAGMAIAARPESA